MMGMKRCPFCGGEAEIVPHRFFSEKLEAWKVESYGVECKNCHASGYQFWECEKHAVEAWNRRSTDEELQFTRQFIVDKGLLYELLNAWEARADNEVR